MANQKTEQLNAAKVKTLPPGRHMDRHRHGLMLVVQRSGSRSWIQRIHVHGKRIDIGLGGFPLVKLAEARDKAFENRKVARAGGDPRTQVNPGVPTFEDATKRVHAIRTEGSKTEKSRKQWLDEVARHVWPAIGHLRVDVITAAQLTAVFVPIWTTKPQIASRVRQRTAKVFHWAISQGYRPDNPAAEPLMANLPNQPEGEHHRALNHSEVAGAIKAIRNCSSGESAKLAFEFLVLTAARKGEVLKARWEEIDLESRTWTLSANRMKSERRMNSEGTRQHRIPLSTAAMAVLARCERVCGGRTGFVFPSSTRGKPLDEKTLNPMIKKAGIDSTLHGFRSSFRDWGGETGKPREVLEAALAHKVADKTEAAYARSDLFDRRVPVMQAWADYISG